MATSFSPPFPRIHHLRRSICYCLPYRPAPTHPTKSLLPLHSTCRVLSNLPPLHLHLATFLLASLASALLHRPSLVPHIGNKQLLVPHLLHKTPHQHTPLQHPTSTILPLQFTSALHQTFGRLLYYTCPPSHRTFGIVHTRAVHRAHLCDLGHCGFFYPSQGLAIMIGQSQKDGGDDDGDKAKGKDMDSQKGVSISCAWDQCSKISWSTPSPSSPGGS